MTSSTSKTPTSRTPTPTSAPTIRTPTPADRVPTPNNISPASNIAATRASTPKTTKNISPASNIAATTRTSTSTTPKTRAAPIPAPRTRITTAPTTPEDINDIPQIVYTGPSKAEIKIAILCRSSQYPESEHIHVVANATKGNTEFYRTQHWWNSQITQATNMLKISAPFKWLDLQHLLKIGNPKVHYYINGMNNTQTLHPVTLPITKANASKLPIPAKGIDNVYRIRINLEITVGLIRNATLDKINRRKDFQKTLALIQPAVTLLAESYTHLPADDYNNSVREYIQQTKQKYHDNCNNLFESKPPVPHIPYKAPTPRKRNAATNTSTTSSTDSGNMSTATPQKDEYDVDLVAATIKKLTELIPQSKKRKLNLTSTPTSTSSSTTQTSTSSTTSSNTSEDKKTTDPAVQLNENPSKLTEGELNILADIAMTSNKTPLCSRFPNPRQSESDHDADQQSDQLEIEEHSIKSDVESQKSYKHNTERKHRQYYDERRSPRRSNSYNSDRHYYPRNDHYSRNEHRNYDNQHKEHDYRNSIKYRLNNRDNRRPYQRPQEPEHRHPREPKQPPPQKHESKHTEPAPKLPISKLHEGIPVIESFDDSKHILCQTPEGKLVYKPKTQRAGKRQKARENKQSETEQL